MVDESSVIFVRPNLEDGKGHHPAHQCDACGLLHSKEGEPIYDPSGQAAFYVDEQVVYRNINQSTA